MKTQKSIETPIENVIETNETDEVFDVETTAIEAPAKPRSAAERLAEIEALEMPRAKAKDLLGKEFDILGATYSKIKKKDKDSKGNDVFDDVVMFKLRVKQTGETVVVAKNLTVFTDVYPQYFAEPDAEPMLSRTFVELVGKEVSGNAPITIRKYGE